MVDASDFRRRTTKHLGAPGIEVGVKMDDRHRPVGPVDRPQQGKRDGVVSTKRNDPRQGLALLCRAQLVSIRGWVAREDGMVAFFDLMKSPRIVIPGNEFVNTK